MKIEIIKWMVSYADGFNWSINSVNECCIITPDGQSVYIHKRNLTNIEESDAWHKSYYPLLLQRAIEGIEEKLKLEILAYKSKRNEFYMSQVFRSEPEDDFPEMEKWFDEFDNIDEAKEASLEYVYEQEKNQ